MLCRLRSLWTVQFVCFSSDSFSTFFLTHPQKIGKTERDPILTDGARFPYTPENERLEPKNHLSEKDNHLLDLHYCVQNSFILRGVNENHIYTPQRTNISKTEIQFWPDKFSSHPTRWDTVGHFCWKVFWLGRRSPQGQVFFFGGGRSMRTERVG